MADTDTRRTTNDSTAESRLCCQCGERLPLTSFRRRGRSSHLRHRECASCHAGNMRFQRRARKERDAEAYLAGRLATLRHRRTLNQRLALIDELNHRLGGPVRVAELFHRQLQRVQMEHRHGSVLRMLGQFFSLSVAVAQLPETEFHDRLCVTLGGIAAAIDDEAETR